MMLSSYGLEQIAKQRARELMREAEQWRLLHPSSQPTWLTRQVRWLLRRLEALTVTFKLPARTARQQRGAEEKGTT